MTASDCSNINSSEGRVGKQNRKLLKRAVQVKEQVSEFCKFEKKTSVLESLFNKIACLKVCNSIKKSLHHIRFPVKFSNFLRTPFLQNSFSGHFEV